MPKDVSLLGDPVAQELLKSTIPARLAYIALDGTPRVISVWFVWNGTDIVMGTPAPTSKVAALRRNPHVALEIETDVWPYKVLSIRGSVTVELVDGVTPEYTQAAQHYFGPEAAASRRLIGRAMFRQLAVACGAPDWVGCLDFKLQQCVLSLALDLVGSCSGADRGGLRPAPAQHGRPGRSGHPRGAGRQPVPVHRVREDPRCGAAGRGPDGRGRRVSAGTAAGAAAAAAGRLVVIENCAVATMDGTRHEDSGTEHASGHIVVERRADHRGGGGPGTGGRADGARRVDGTGCLVTPGPGQHPPPPVPVATRGSRSSRTCSTG